MNAANRRTRVRHGAVRSVYTRQVKLPRVERIRGRDGLEAARRGGGGVVRVPDPGGALHALSCGMLDEMVAGNTTKLRLYRKGLAEARKSDPGVGLCEECDPVGCEIRDALNRSGAFLHAGVIQKLEGMGYETRSELPVSVAPFLSDPSKQPHATSLRRPPDRSEVRLLNKTAFQSAVAASQDGSQRRARTIDVCASHKDDKGSVYTAVIEVKRLDPAYVSWVFLVQGNQSRDYSVVTKSNQYNIDTLRLMKVPKSYVGSRDIYVQRKMIQSRPDDMGVVTDHGMEITYDPRAGYKHQGTSLYDAVSQVLEGAFGLIVDAVTRQAATGKTGMPEERYIPVIVTTANLLTYEYSPGTLDPESLDAPDGALNKVGAVIYRCPHPACIRFPDQIIAPKSDKEVGLSERWPVVVATAGGLGGMLSSPRIFHGATGAL